MNTTTIKEIERAITYHISYDGGTTGRYLKIMDRLAAGYSGSLSQKICSLLDNYFKAVGVDGLDEAIDRLRKINNL